MLVEFASIDRVWHRHCRGRSGCKCVDKSRVRQLISYKKNGEGQKQMLLLKKHLAGWLFFVFIEIIFIQTRFWLECLHEDVITHFRKCLESKAFHLVQRTATTVTALEGAILRGSRWLTDRQGIWAFKALTRKNVETTKVVVLQFRSLSLVVEKVKKST